MKKKETNKQAKACKKETKKATKPATTKKASKPTTKARTKAPTKKATAAKTTTPVTPKPTVTKGSPKSAGKSTSASNNSVKTAVTAKKNTSKPAAAQAQSELVTIELRIHHDAKGGHPHIMIDTVNGKNVSVGTTHDEKKGKKHNNIPLEHNPLGGKEQAYMRKQGTVDDKKNYGSISKTGKITVNDNAKAKQIGEKAKQKELKKQKSKK